jgi:hypothetical protein
MTVSKLSPGREKSSGRRRAVLLAGCVATALALTACAATALALTACGGGTEHTTNKDGFAQVP